MMKKEIGVALLVMIILIGCGKTEKTYEEGLEEGFKAGYYEALWQSDDIAAASGKIVVYADKYGYLHGYHDGIAGKVRLTEAECDTKILHESFMEGYEQGYIDASEGKDSLSDYGGVLTWHNVNVEEEKIEYVDMNQ